MTKKIGSPLSIAPKSHLITFDFFSVRLCKNSDNVQKQVQFKNVGKEQNKH